MTEENYNYRTSQILLRNQFPGCGKWKIQIIPKFQEKPGDFDDLLLIGFDKTRMEDQNYLDRMVHFFLYDYRFERVWKKPDADVEKLSRYRATLSPDFSMYLEMAPVMQLFNVFRNRWCGAYWASKGLRVIPTVNWGDETTFDFCFEGIEKGSVVAVSTYMASEHGNRQEQKEWFMAGYNEMLQRVEPERIICYNTPFPEMDGNIVYVDYERSSWKYMSYKQGKRSFADDIEAYKIGGQAYSSHDTMGAFMDIPTIKGGGSAYGGKWQPSKPEDERLIGQPGEIKTTVDRNGNVIQDIIGDDGYAVMERHNTDHGHPEIHTNPHDHEITWDDNYPFFGDHINYPDSVPEFKKYGGTYCMSTYPQGASYTNFESISDFKWSMHCGGEVQFIWNGIKYCAFGNIMRAGKRKMVICQTGSAEINRRTAKWCDNADEVLEYMVGKDRLRDVITQVEVFERTI